MGSQEAFVFLPKIIISRQIIFLCPSNSGISESVINKEVVFLLVTPKLLGDGFSDHFVIFVGIESEAVEHAVVVTVYADQFAITVLGHESLIIRVLTFILIELQFGHVCLFG